MESHRTILTRDLDDAERERDELRAVLAPMLDEPILLAYEVHLCRFCNEHDICVDPMHAPGCPFLDRDRLLGR